VLHLNIACPPDGKGPALVFAGPVQPGLEGRAPFKTDNRIAYADLYFLRRILRIVVITQAQQAEIENPGTVTVL